ncbi:hypothetical protein [Novosphingobium sp.]|uniref:hypothetical protein n=1 Tax=Novosphingobium sp. TaxID=1874826 RepID=UPI0026230189|nr:hypothetical protein [Novosphingobium sp.]
MLRLVACLVATAGILASSTAVLAKTPPGSAEQPCKCEHVTSPCLSPMAPESKEFKQTFEVRDVRLYLADSTGGRYYAEYQACVVTDTTSVKSVSVRAMLIDQQGRNIATTNGTVNVNPNPSNDMPQGAPAIVASWTGRTQGAMTAAEWQNKSSSIIIVVDWTDKDSGKHQDSFYLPYVLAQPRPQS